MTAVDATDRRYVCQECATKWFVPAGRPVPEHLTTCPACSGALVPLGDDGQPAARP